MRRTEEFADPRVAEGAFAKAEAEFRATARIQVVLFSAESIESIKATHPHYFADGSQMSDVLPV